MFFFLSRVGDWFRRLVRRRGPTILNDLQIAELARAGMITPFCPELIRQVDSRPVLSFGSSSYGYDLRLSPKEFWIFRDVPGVVIDPKDFNRDALERLELQRDEHGEFFVMPGDSYGLGVALEHLDLPPDITALFVGKSTYARCAIIANTTPGEAGWRGHLTIEIKNAGRLPCRVYVGEGIVQTWFFRGEPCGRTYEGRKYQDQPQAVTLAKV